MSSTRVTIAVQLRERQLLETIRALEAVDRSTLDAAGAEALATALERFRAALQQLHDRVR